MFILFITAEQALMDNFNFTDLTQELKLRSEGYPASIFAINIFLRDVFLSHILRSSFDAYFRELKTSYLESESQLSFTGDVMGIGSLHKISVFDELINEIECSVLAYIRTFSKMHQKIQVFHQKSWPVFLKSGTTVDCHHHANADLSAIYYYDVPVGGSGGELLFYSPIDLGLPSNAKGVDFWHNNQIIKVIKPYSGLLIIFPSILKHEVLKYTGDKQRISLSFDFTLTAASHFGSGQIENLSPSIDHWQAFRSHSS